jgi:Domain of unknown function (DUF4419)
MSHAPAEQDKSRPNTFSVDHVVPAEGLIWTEPLRAHVAKRFRRRLLFLPESEKAVTNVLYDSISSRALSQEKRARFETNVVSRCHPLIDAVATAFSQHRPLTLSPDCIWLVIEQGFAHHVAENAETLRYRLVRHTGRQELTAEVSELSLASFELAISNFSSQIRDASDPVLHETLISDFSTTTPAIRTASEVVLMDCYSSYFTYAMHCICGIPRITVTGSLNDWQRIRARVEVFETFDLGWWVARLRPILDQFIRTVDGYPTLEFWQAIYKPKQAYGTETVTGWIADFFPYLNDSPTRRRNHIFGYERQDWAIPVENGVETRRGFGEPGAEKGVAQKSFPSGLASVPVKLGLPNGSTSEMDLVAGFLAVEQDPEDLALEPLISWSVAERAPTQPVVI